MGNQAQRKRKAARAAEHRAKKEVVQAAKLAETTSAHDDSPVPADNTIPATKQTKSALQKRAPPEASASIRRSTHLQCSASTPTCSTSSQETLAHLSNQSNTTSRPHRMNAASAQAQLL